MLAVLFASAAALFAPTSSAFAQNYVVDQVVSSDLTKFLHKHRLPLVGAEVSNADDGTRRVVLYGYVASALGKIDAEGRTVKFLGRDGLSITNSIRVDPAINKLNQSPAPTEASSQDPDEQMQWDKLIDGADSSAYPPSR